MDGWAPQVRPLEGCAQRPVWFMLGEYDIASVSLDPGTIARATLENYCHSNGVEPRFENWYDNGKYHTLVMYDQIMLRWCALQSFEAARIPTQQKWRSLRGITLCAISAEMKTEVSAMTAETEI